MMMTDGVLLGLRTSVGRYLERGEKGVLMLRRKSLKRGLRLLRCELWTRSERRASLHKCISEVDLHVENVHARKFTTLASQRERSLVAPNRSIGRQSLNYQPQDPHKTNGKHQCQIYDANLTREGLQQTSDLTSSLC